MDILSQSIPRENDFPIHTEVAVLPLFEQEPKLILVPQEDTYITEEQKEETIDEDIEDFNEYKEDH